MHEVGFTLRVANRAHLHECLRGRPGKICACLWLQGIRTCPCAPAHGAIMSLPHLHMSVLPDDYHSVTSSVFVFTNANAYMDLCASVSKTHADTCVII